MSGFPAAVPCPCGTDRSYDACCGRLHRGAAQAATPEELMRSRYSGYAVGGPVGHGYVYRTWHPRTRPDDVQGDPDLVWTGLQVLDAAGDEVEFVATFARDGRPGRLHERSRFEQRAGRWLYVEAVER